MSAEHKLERMFNPRSIAVVGISTKEAGSGWAAGGMQFVTQYQRLGYEGKIYPIHPTATEPLGGLQPCPSLAAVPEPIDLVVICVRNTVVPSVLEECAKVGAKNIHIFSSGFSEMGEPEGMELQKQIVDIAEKGGLRVVGPNCMGVAYVPSAKLSVWPILPPKSGPVAYVSQSGVNCFQFITYGLSVGLFFSKVISYGNACVLDSTDYLDYLAQDEETKIICMYAEGVKDGQRFTKLVKEVNKKKPVVIWKAGISEVGARAAASHTGALAGSEKVWDAFFKQTGAIRVNSLDELADVAMTLSYMNPPPQSRRVGVMLGGGGYSVQTADLCGREGLELPMFSKGTIEKLKTIVPLVGTGFKNPLDSEPMAESSSMIMQSVEALAADPQIDTVIMSSELGFLRKPERIIELKDNLSKYVKENPYKKSFAAILETAMVSKDMKEPADELRKGMPRAGVPVHRTMARLLRAVAKVAEYHEFQRKAQSS